MVRVSNPIVLNENHSIKKINNLYREVSENLQDSLQKLFEIGKILNEEKQNLPHGKFTEWVETNLPFGIRQAQKYMRLNELNSQGLIEENSKANSSSLLSINEILKSVSEKPQKETKKESKSNRIEKLEKEIKSLKSKLKEKQNELKELIG